MKRIPMLCLSIIFFSNFASASLLLKGDWSGIGKIWSNGNFTSIEVILAFEGESLKVETIAGGFASEALHVFSKNTDGSFLWLDVNGKKIGNGICRENTCTFTGVFGRSNVIHNNKYLFKVI